MTTDNYNDDNREERDQRPATPQFFRNIFGIIMVVVYVGMGVLLFCNFFDFKPEFDWVRYIGGVILVLYGIWRAYRYRKGID